MATTIEKMNEREAAIMNLRRWLNDGDGVYAERRHASESGASHAIRLLLPMRDDGEGRLWIMDISSLAAKAMGRSLHPKGGVWCRGGGMDMTFECVHELGRALNLDLKRERL